MYGEFNLSRDELRHLYWDLQLTAKEISKRLRLSITTVYYWLKKYNIPRRTKSEARKLVWMNPVKRQNYIRGIRRYGKSVRKFNLGKDELYHLYWVEGLNQSQIAKKFGVTQKIVRRRFIEYNIPVKEFKRVMRETITEKRRRELSEIMKQRWKNPEYREKMINATRKSLKKYKGIHRSPHTEFKRGHKTDDSIREKIRRTVLRNYQEDPELLKRVLSCQKPNKAEKTLITLFRKCGFPFRYVGDGRVVIDGKCPDFIANDGSKKVVELFGRPWHDPSHSDKFDVAYDRTEKGRREFYSQHDYECLILWDDELDDEIAIAKRIRSFMG